MSTMEKDNRPSIGFNLNEFNSTTILTEKNKNGDEDEYNPFEHRNMEHSYSTAGSLAHLLKGSLGTGILAMPLAYKNAGLLFGAIGTLIVGFLCTHCVHILVKTSQGICKKGKIPSLGFAETAEKAFEFGPIATRKYAKFARFFCDYGLVATNLGANCIYIVFMATTFRDMLNFALDINLDVRWYIVAVLLPCICIGEIRQLKYLVPFSALGNFFIVITFSITLYYILSGPLHISERPTIASWKQMPLFFGTVLFAMEGIGAVMPIENSMRKPQHFLGCPGVLNTAMTTVVVLYGAIGFLGYIRYGDNVKGSVTMNLPDGIVIAQVAQVLVAFTVFFSFGLIFFVPADILWRKMEPRIPKDKHNLSQIVFRAGLILILGGISAAVPKLEPFIGLVGAILLSMLGLFVPAVIQTIHLYPDDLGCCNWILYKNILIVIFSFFALFSGSFASVLEIIHLYST